MPNAQSKEGPNMRVQSITEVNTRQQQNPFLLQKTGLVSNSKTATGLAFEDYFNSYLTQKNAAKVTRHPQHQPAGLFWGFYPSLRVQQKPGPTLESNA